MWWLYQLLPSLGLTGEILGWILRLAEVHRQLQQVLLSMQQNLRTFLDNLDGSAAPPLAFNANLLRVLLLATFVASIPKAIACSSDSSISVRSVKQSDLLSVAPDLPISLIYEDRAFHDSTDPQTSTSVMLMDAAKGIDIAVCK